jgi:hypothetical protein
LFLWLDHTSRVGLPFSHTDVTTAMAMISDIKENVERIRPLLEEDDGEEDLPEEDG